MVERRISIVTGTLNRRHCLPRLIANTVDADPRLELVLVDGGSDDGTLEYVKGLSHPAIRLVEIGHRSPYPQFMNTGVRAAACDYVCQWNDDVYLVNRWDEVFRALDQSEVYLFAWAKQRHIPWLRRWVLIDTVQPDGSGQIVMNYGIYHKDVFRKVGLYNEEYHFYCADGDLSYRAWAFGCTVKRLPKVRVVSRRGVRKSRHYDLAADLALYEKCRALYFRRELPPNITYLEPAASSASR